MTSVEPAQAGPDGRTSDLRRLARGSSLNLAGSVVAAALNLVLPVIITRSLAKDDAGLFFQATALFTILLNVGTIGADTGVLRSLPRALVLDRRPDLRRYLVLAVVPAAVFSVLLSVALLLLADPLSRLITGDGAHAAAFHDVLLVMLPWVPVAVVYAITMSASRGLDSIRPLVFVEKIGRNALETGAAGTAAVVSGSVAMVVMAWAAPYLAMLVVVAAWVLRRLRRIDARRGDRASAATPWAALGREFWGFSAPRAASRVFTVALQRVDVLVVGALRGPADAAVYAAATRFLVLGLMFVQAIQQVMTPKISEFLALGENARAETVYRTTTAWLTLVSWPIYLMAMQFSPLLLSIFGPGYERGAVAAGILCAAMLVATACGPVDSMLLMGGRSGLSLMNTGLALATNVGLDLLLVPHLGITGAALGWAAAILVNNLLPLWQVNRHLSMHPLGEGTKAALVICLVSFGVVVGTVRALLGVDLVAFLVAGALGTLTYLALARRSADALELAALGSVLKRRRRSSAS
ncbi:lipopolysaccharide biosynthesis protein [Nocardioides sp. MAHUQ-72]|uniref:lipopolysaccharide biosynthesis protein n=1 Tax=unclassified Nocardioides TaxID=2615069 RepID=UPI0036142144